VVSTHCSETQVAVVQAIPTVQDGHSTVLGVHSEQSVDKEDKEHELEDGAEEEGELGIGSVKDAINEGEGTDGDDNNVEGDGMTKGEEIKNDEEEEAEAEEAEEEEEQWWNTL